MFNLHNESTLFISRSNLNVEIPVHRLTNICSKLLEIESISQMNRIISGMAIHSPDKKLFHSHDERNGHVITIFKGLPLSDCFSFSIRHLCPESMYTITRSTQDFLSIMNYDGSC